MTFELRSGSPLYPFVVGLFLLSVLGIGLVLLSRNASLKRRVLPVTLGAFSIAAYLVIDGSGQIHTTLAKLGVGLALIVNAVWVFRLVQFCSKCGATAARTVMNAGLCPNCAGRGSSSAAA
jgi:hypothetical protein